MNIVDLVTAIEVKASEREEMVLRAVGEEIRNARNSVETVHEIEHHDFGQLDAIASEFVEMRSTLVPILQKVASALETLIDLVKEGKLSPVVTMDASGIRVPKTRLILKSDPPRPRKLKLTHADGTETMLEEVDHAS